MGITRNALIHLLGQHHFSSEKENLSFSQLQILDGPMDQTETLYLTTQQDFPPEGHILQLASLQQINEAFLCFHRYMQWREQALRLAHIEHDLYTLLEISSSFLGWDIWIVTPDYRMDAGAVDHFPGHMPPFTRMAQTDVESLYHDNPAFDETFQLRVLQAYPQYHVEGGRLYYYNLFQENLYLGRLLILIPESHENPGAMELMQTLCEDVEVCYRFLYLRRRQDDLNYRFYDLWKALLENQPLDTAAVQNALAHMGWNPQDEYQVLYLVPAGYLYSPQTLKYYAVQLESSFPGCIAAELDKGLYCLHNLSIDRSPNFRQQLGEFLRENLFRVGISNSFRDFFDSQRYRLQAEDAIHFGQQKDPSLWRYDFCDYVSQYSLSQCLSQYAPRDLCPRNLQILLDHENGDPEGELMQTLYQYYTCQFNAQLAAQKLFIHRTTFFYRMNKIQKIAAFHPEDPEETCQILLAFLALRKNENEEK